MSSSFPLDISRLSISERIQLAQDIWDSISTADEALPLTEAQRQELDRRLDSYEQDPALGSSWDEVKQRITDLT